MSRREVFVGFDSAWADNPKQPGAISLLKFVDGRPSEFIEPRLASFAEAAGLIEAEVEDGDFCLIAIDQPTLVPNSSSCRPVERVAASLISKLKGGVQPANRSKAGMFGDEAPIWSFLKRIGAVENPGSAREASQGRFLIEVFPALALPALIDELVDRGRGAKYNPANRRPFCHEDWKLISHAVANGARRYGAEPLAVWAGDQVGRTGLRKSDQDKLDAAICVLIAIMWRRAALNEMMVIGDRASGYMVSPVSSRTRHILSSAAMRRGVSVDEQWDSDVSCN